MGDVSNLIGQFEEHYNDASILGWRHKKQSRQTGRIKEAKRLHMLKIAALLKNKFELNT